MSYIEVTIWNPFRNGNFVLKPHFEWWSNKSGFDFEWLFVEVLVSLKD
jgi:hypothetical protein